MKNQDFHRSVAACIIHMRLEARILIFSGYPILLVSKRESNNLDLGAGSAVVDLAAPLAALIGPREVRNRDEEEGVAGIGNTSKGVVPG